MDKSGVESELIDLSGVPLDAWPSLPLHPAADGSLRRLLSRIDDPAGSLGGYNPQRDERD
ncbi:hypothetical protein [Streptomyces cupreus]|uniref:FXSXX-COOH protein n=1 Tax=Streptomyces cupreus TaxID=2759956 RepID=A0A7X1J6Q3_9ACTN|nr:hypothetical protein [Streptomyces cupreus]MBC2904142.1 hypothetical protein [Streptomyces cupreus]